jgi:phage regulator Rha-like protein
MTKNKPVIIKEIQNRIYTIRGVQVMLDEDLAVLYNVETRVLNQAVRRNKERFPERFCFKLTDEEYERLRSQFVILEKNSTLTSRNSITESKRGKHRKYLPYVFTEQGVAMLSAVLRTATAVEISVKIIDAFISMRKFILANAQVFQRLDTLELKQLETDKKIEKVLTAIESKEIQPKQGIFYEGQMFDAHLLVCELIKNATKSIKLIDNYIDETVLILFAKRDPKVTVTIYTKNISEQLKLDLKKYNAQYPTIEIKEFGLSHDRFLIVDDKQIYHFGASIKDLGKKWFAVSKIDINSFELLSKLE